MSKSGQPLADTIRIALQIADQGLAERLVGLLTGVPGITLVDEGEAADVALIATVQPATETGDEDLLTPREREVLGLLAEGASNKLIARRLGISVHTAKFHVRSLTDKLDATGRTDAVAHAARLGVIHL
ncbi:response regulator transcription factor [Tabrizicola sp.]|uniref:response regulator transcription factor n=1 Tax=Tabrizicola sp. TaxID=2005166 RepID=UPI003F389A64